MGKSGAALPKRYIPTNIRTVKHIILERLQAAVDGQVGQPPNWKIHIFILVPNSNPGDHINSLCRRDQSPTAETTSTAYAVETKTQDTPLSVSTY